MQGPERLPGLFTPLHFVSVKDENKKNRAAERMCGL